MQVARMLNLFLSHGVQVIVVSLLQIHFHNSMNNIMHYRSWLFLEGFYFPTGLFATFCRQCSINQSSFISSLSERKPEFTTVIQVASFVSPKAVFFACTIGS